MSDGLHAGKNSQWMLPLHRICSRCGQSASSISLVRTREGKSFRLCASCGGLAWVLEEK
jgi:transcription elongation factor Elf1